MDQDNLALKRSLDTKEPGVQERILAHLSRSPDEVIVSWLDDLLNKIRGYDLDDKLAEFLATFHERTEFKHFKVQAWGSRRKEERPISVERISPYTLEKRHFGPAKEIEAELIKVSIHYGLGGHNFWSGKIDPRGYSLHVGREKYSYYPNGRTKSSSFMVGTNGWRHFLKEATRFSAKTLEKVEPPKDVIDRLSAQIKAIYAREVAEEKGLCRDCGSGNGTPFSHEATCPRNPERASSMTVEA